MASGRIGMSAYELERELEWAMRKASRDPEQRLRQLQQAFVDLMVKNNQAIARDLAERDRDDLPEEG